jgi:hypothetical protein
MSARRHGAAAAIAIITVSSVPEKKEYVRVVAFIISSVSLSCQRPPGPASTRVEYVMGAFVVSMKLRVMERDPPFAGRSEGKVRKALPTGAAQPVAPERPASDAEFGRLSSASEIGPAMRLLVLLVTVTVWT